MKDGDRDEGGTSYRVQGWPPALCSAPLRVDLCNSALGSCAANRSPTRQLSSWLERRRRCLSSRGDVEAKFEFVRVHGSNIFF